MQNQVKRTQKSFRKNQQQKERAFDTMDGGGSGFLFACDRHILCGVLCFVILGTLNLNYEVS